MGLIQIHISVNDILRSEPYCARVSECMYGGQLEVTVT
jgi:hypothetical protein